MTKQTQYVDNAAVSADSMAGTGAPAGLPVATKVGTGTSGENDMLSLRQSALVEAIETELLDYFDGLSGDPKIHVSEARWIALECLRRAVRAN